MIDPATFAPIPLPNEETILTLQGAEFTLNFPEASAAGSAGTPSTVVGKKTVASGKVWVTDHRIIFIPKQAKDTPYTSLSIPLFQIVSTSFVQPIFGSNHLLMAIRPTPEGGLVEGTKAEVRFKDRGVFEFAKVLEAARERALHRESQNNEEALPMYSGPPYAGPSSAAAGGSQSTAIHPPEDAPPGYEL